MAQRSLVLKLMGISAVALLGASLGGACSATGAGHQFTGSGGASAGSAAGGHATGSGDGGELDLEAGTTIDAADEAATCAAQSIKAEQLPLDMFIMMDQSGSMTDAVQGGQTKWQAVTDALKTFVQQPNSGGISVGIQYFGLPAAAVGPCPPTCTTDADCNGTPCFFGMCPFCNLPTDSCNAADYAKPDVEIAPLPGISPQIIASLNAHMPTTGTPTSAALQGAIDHATSWATQHPSDVTIVLFATDGDPSSCDTDLANIDAIAAKAFAGSPKIATFVIGVGSSLSALNGIAASGGTGQAFIVDTNQNANQQFLDALNAIRGSALTCSYLIPKPMSGIPDYEAVNVQYTPGMGAVEVLSNVADQAHCPPSGDAWYYDSNATPTKILLCDAACTKISADAKGQVDVLLGCKTIAN